MIHTVGHERAPSPSLRALGTRHCSDRASPPASRHPRDAGWEPSVHSLTPGRESQLVRTSALAPPVQRRKDTREIRVIHRTIIQRAILATDGSEHARATTMFASTLTWPAGTVISVASVVEVPNPGDLAIRHMQSKGFEDWRQILEQSHTAARDQARRYTADAAAALRARHSAVDVDEVICLGEPAAELLALARSVEAELLIAGARGHTALECLLLGSVSEALVTEAPCPVLIGWRRPAFGCRCPPRHGWSP